MGVTAETATIKPPPPPKKKQKKQNETSRATRFRSGFNKGVVPIIKFRHGSRNYTPTPFSLLGKKRLLPLLLLRPRWNDGNESRGKKRKKGNDRPFRGFCSRFCTVCGAREVTRVGQTARSDVYCLWGGLFFHFSSSSGAVTQTQRMTCEPVSCFC